MTVTRLRRSLQSVAMALLLPLLSVTSLTASAQDSSSSSLTNPLGQVFSFPGTDSSNTTIRGNSGSDQDNSSSGSSYNRNGTTTINGNANNPAANASRDAASRTDQSNQTNNNNSFYTDRRTPPPPPSEFQKFVRNATGRLLPMFGQRFFDDANSGAAPFDNIPVAADYIVGPGDELVIRAWGSIDVDYRARVDRNGQINLPRIGSFTVAGVKASQLEEQLRGQISRLFTNFNLNVTLGQLRGVKVFVVGPAQKPGVYNLSSQSTMLSAVVAAGGPLPSGSMRKIGLRRDGKLISELDVYDFLVQGDKSRDVQLMPGDVVVFNPAGPRVALTGAIDTPAIYELRTPQEPLRDVLRYAGGAPLLANPGRVQLERVDNGQLPASRSVDIFKLDGNGLELPLRDGDVLTMLAISPQFANAVTLRGHVAQPLRYQWTPGMRIRDLIPDKEALISADYYRRKNLLVQVLPPDRDSRDGSYQRNDGYNQGNGYRNNNDGSTRSGSGSNSYGNGNNNSGNSNYNTGNGNYGSGYGNNNSNYNDGYNNGGNYGYDDSQAYGTRGGRNLGAAGAAGFGGGMAGDRTDGSYANGNGMRNGQSSNDRYDDRNNGRPRLSTTTLFDELNWDYAVIERLNREKLTTQIIPFNLGKAVLQNDPENNIELQPGDVVTVYSQKDLKVPVGKQTRLVSIEGEIGSPGVYQLKAGETLKQLLQRAGGFTNEAYVYGLDFSREETRRQQKENLQQAITRLETLAATQAARDAANRREDQATTAVSNAATQAQLSRLRRLEPNGRIALELAPDVMTIDSLPDVPLENGDRITIPARPGFVTVAGAVVNSNAFLWRAGRSAGDYMKLAGLDEAADPSNMFILRADGTVSHAGDRRGVFGIGGGLQGQPMYPGDALIVPNQLDYETWGRAFIRNLKDFSQIFSQFGLGAAAIVTLRNN